MAGGPQDRARRVARRIALVDVNANRTPAVQTNDFAGGQMVAVLRDAAGACEGVRFLAPGSSSFARAQRSAGEVTHARVR